ncbi:adenylate/guanylate cyclase domain-containing protein [Gordonia sp. FQ]|uniref:adenylate/guanylate cyclase domain-containing protein n=1 Tax=Gordonia sp. FQ TaxID=3446634 RepID=UPI003F82FDBB
MPARDETLTRCLREPHASGPPDDAARRQQLVSRASYGAAAVNVGFAAAGATFGGPSAVTIVNVVAGLALLLVPSLRRFGPLIPAVAFFVLATATLCALTVYLGTSSGLLFYFFAMAAGVPMIVGGARGPYTAVSLVVCSTAVSVLHFRVPYDTGLAPDWLMTTGFVVNTLAAGGLAAYVMAFGMRQIRRTEAALEEQYDRSEDLLDNILPRSVSDRLKRPDPGEIADTYDDASILFADIAGFTEMSSHNTPADVVHFLNRLYSTLDRLTDRHGLEKIKTTGDSYMVVSGVPLPRPDHLESLARFALDLRAECARVPGPDGRPMHLRIGLAHGPVVAGVVGSRKFFYDVWGDAVNLASRMESTGEPDRIQVPESVRDRLAGEFRFEPRGVVPVKGKGYQRTWFLLGPA